jgi:hypothetical protein
MFALSILRFDAEKGKGWWSGGYVLNKNVIKHENRRPPRFSHNSTYPPNHLAKPPQRTYHLLLYVITYFSFQLWWTQSEEIGSCGLATKLWGRTFQKDTDIGKTKVTFEFLFEKLNFYGISLIRDPGLIISLKILTRNNFKMSSPFKFVHILWSNVV